VTWVLQSVVFYASLFPKTGEKTAARKPSVLVLSFYVQNGQPQIPSFHFSLECDYYRIKTEWTKGSGFNSQL